MSEILNRLATVLESRKMADPAQSYVAKLFFKGDDAILKKIGEEATETVMAAKDLRQALVLAQTATQAVSDGDAALASEKLVNEVADLWFHSMVMLAHFKLTPQQVLNELARREGLSGLEEKAARKTL
jgi:phosphoribosyl-ATP pyrophosphohydrolase